MKKSEKSSNRLIQIVEVLNFHNLLNGITPQKLRKILEDLGPTFVKLGQILSMRPDLIPIEYCDELVLLRSEVSAMSFDEVLEIINEEYTLQNYDDIFSYINPIPIGSASIAQVHYAILKNGKSVVLKVQRRAVRVTMYKDILFLKKAIVLVKLRPSLGNSLDYLTIIEELWYVAQQELDFLIEASHLEEFRLNNADVSYVYCPKVNIELTTAHILAMEYINGIELLNFDELIKIGYDRYEIATKLAENYLKQILVDGFFHADPHPGNVFISDGKIVWLDLGMMGRLSEKERTLLTEAVIAIKNEDAFQLKKIVLSMGVIRNKIDHSILLSDLDNALSKYANLDFAHMNLGIVISDLMNIAIRNNIGMPNGITMLSRGLVTIESVLESIYPGLNFNKIASAYLIGKAFNFKNELLSIYSSLIYGIKKSVDIPNYFSDLLKMTVKGQTKINLELTGSERPLKELDNMINKIVVSIICAALLIGSSLISTTEMEMRLFGIPAFGVVGFSLAVILGNWLIIKIIKNSKNNF
ncbi:ABC1 kinase family protein [Fusibacter bizertensis]